MINPRTDQDVRKLTMAEKVMRLKYCIGVELHNKYPAGYFKI